MLIDKGASDKVSEVSQVTRPDSGVERAKYKPEPYAWEEIEHLFPDGVVPDELKDIDDPM